MRLPFTQLAPELYRALLNLSKVAHESSLGPVLINLVNLRVSQINGCCYCLDMHSHSLHEAGVHLRKIDTLAAWSESPFFDARERAALAWAEAVTDISRTHAPDDLFAALKQHFSEREIVELGYAIAVINSWNRLSIGFRISPSLERPAVAGAA